MDRFDEVENFNKYADRLVDLLRDFDIMLCRASDKGILSAVAPKIEGIKRMLDDNSATAKVYLGKI